MQPRTKHTLFCMLICFWIWGSIFLAIGAPFYLIGALSGQGIAKVIVLIFLLGLALGSVIAFSATAYARYKTVREQGNASNNDRR